ncbi:hypothetical protein E4T66_07975 [Sinimarinibacterium sp. CAU 1509]|uniref:hypothetical protein n=1 Tax=Sinimarinibacterium sp. CAU 1509 TaxID=2562283 RepID=UPI0010AD4992|nr:hypothetical protein [Sinimarinibacterium sp. CAU 1509]TJY62156.1 hypothetical protein E4T66_07975 [Sinimarinibacterium sp. CAU 1509]
MIDYQSYLSLREIDQVSRSPKGTAFRAFRDIETQLVRDVDFVLLHHADDAEAIAALRASGKIYPGSINVILLSPAVGQRLLGALSSVPKPRQ